MNCHVYFTALNQDYWLCMTATNGLRMCAVTCTMCAVTCTMCGVAHCCLCGPSRLR